MAASFSDVTAVAPYVNGARIWEATVSDTVVNSQASGYNSFWSPLAYALRLGDLVKVTCSNGKWLGVVIALDGSGITASGWNVNIDPIAGNVNSF